MGSMGEAYWDSCGGFGSWDELCGRRQTPRTCFAYIIEQSDVDVVQAPYNHTAVLWAAWGGHAETLEMLVEAGGSLEARDRREGTAMHIAARSVCVARCHFLVFIRVSISLCVAVL